MVKRRNGRFECKQITKHRRETIGLVTSVVSGQLEKQAERFFFYVADTNKAWI